MLWPLDPSHSVIQRRFQQQHGVAKVAEYSGAVGKIDEFVMLNLSQIRVEQSPRL